VYENYFTSTQILDAIELIFVTKNWQTFQC